MLRGLKVVIQLQHYLIKQQCSRRVTKGFIHLHFQYRGAIFDSRDIVANFNHGTGSEKHSTFLENGFIWFEFWNP